ncbi:hypothetical protein ACLB2K_048434 [Fragaria x ananassa]
MAAEGVVSVFSKVNDDILQNIMGRLPAVAFACSACVSKTWNRNCSSILCRPMFVSAMSVNPDACEAVDEVFEEVFSRPIRPDFAIVYIGMEYSLPVTSLFVFEKLHRAVPVIINQAVGLIGVEAGADENEITEIKWEPEKVRNLWTEFMLMGGNTINGGLILSVGYVPDLKVDVIPLLRSRTQPYWPLMEYFMLEIRGYTASVSGSSNPACITMFGDHRVDIRPIVERLDHVMHVETAIVGDAKGSFLFRRRNQTQHYDMFFFDAAALVFARDQNKSDELGETRFHVAVADGMIPFGPELRSVTVYEDPFARSWISGVVEGVEGYPMLDCFSLLQQLIDQKYNLEGDKDFLPIDAVSRNGDVACRNRVDAVSRNGQRVATVSKKFDFSDTPRGVSDAVSVGIGVSGSVRRSDTPWLKVSVHHSSTQFRTTLACHEVLGGNYYSIIVKGNGIQTGDRFIFLHSDPGSALTRVDDARHSLEALDVSQEVFGGLIFSSHHRGKSFFGASCVDTSPFTGKLSGVPIAGISCAREIRRVLLSIWLVSLPPEPVEAPVLWFFDSLALQMLQWILERQ